MHCHHQFGTNKLDFVFFPSIHAEKADPGEVASSPTTIFVSGLQSQFEEFREESAVNQAKRFGAVPQLRTQLNN